MSTNAATPRRPRHRNPRPVANSATPPHARHLHAPRDRSHVPPPAPIDAEALRAANPLFAELGVRPECLAFLNEMSILQPTPVQAEAIPLALDGRDVVAIAQTGTGKTLAFGLPLMARLADARSRRATALVLSPTRELAQQIFDVLKPMARAMGLRTTCVYGGVGMENQSRDLRAGGGLIIATPGRLIDHIERGNTDFTSLTALVLDEADRMLDMGFLPAIKRILAQLPKQRQTMMFSATFPGEIVRLTADMLDQPVRIEITRQATAVEKVRQSVYTMHHESRQNLLHKLLSKDEVRSAIIFVRTKRRADRVALALKRDGIHAEAIHGDRSQGQRRQAIEAFARGRSRFLVATDVAARGIDITGISHVINFDIPATPEDYVHRIGRTARAQAEGDAITFVATEDTSILESIERTLGRPIDQIEWEGSIKLPLRRTSVAAPRALVPRRGRGGISRPVGRRS